MKRTFNSKEEYIQWLQIRIKTLVVAVIKFCRELPKSPATNVISYQLIKSSTSTGANYRAACRGRSKKEFFSKLCIAVEEADESEYWLEVIEASNFHCDKKQLEWLLKEAGEILALLTKVKDTTGGKGN